MEEPKDYPEFYNRGGACISPGQCAVRVPWKPAPQMTSIDLNNCRWVCKGCQANFEGKYTNLFPAGKCLNCSKMMSFQDEIPNESLKTGYLN